MTKFDINTIINKYSLDAKAVAEKLFPKAKYPKQALDRICRGVAELSIGQLETLAAYIGVTPSILLDETMWEYKNDNGTLVFIHGDYTIKLNYNGAFLTIYKNNILHDTIIAGNSAAMSIPQFINFLNNLISKY